MTFKMEIIIVGWYLLKCYLITTRQAMYITLWHIYVTIVPVEAQ